MTAVELLRNGYGTIYTDFNYFWGSRIGWALLFRWDNWSTVSIYRRITAIFVFAKQCTIAENGRVGFAYCVFRNLSPWKSQKWKKRESCENGPLLYSLNISTALCLLWTKIVFFFAFSQARVIYSSLMPGRRRVAAAGARRRPFAVAAGPDCNY